LFLPLPRVLSARQVVLTCIDMVAAPSGSPTSISTFRAFPNVGADKYKELQQSLNLEEARLKSIRNEVDPAQIEELESTRGVLRFWESQLRAMVWNTENEDGSMIKVMDKPHKIALKIADFEDEDISKAVHFPATRRELLDKLQVRVIVFRDRIKVKAVFPIEPIYYQKCTSP